MKPPAPTCSVLVLGEDSAASGHETLATLARKMFLIIDPACQTQRVSFEPPQNEGARQAVRGNLWKSKDLRDQPKRIDLIGYIATKLSEGPSSFVLFHVDGDRAWGAREEGENVAKFRQFIERDLLQFVEHRRTRVAEMRKRASGGAEIPYAPNMEQLLLAVPYYSIEAWLFQNTEQAMELCRNNPHCRGAHVPLFEQWAADRGALDEVIKPKEQVCFRDKHNGSLAGSGFPADKVYGADKSFAETVNRLLECATLTAALADTHSA